MDADIPVVTQQCASCSSATASLRACARCKVTRYCSKDCQAAHWAAHKPDCKRANYILRFQLFPGDFTDLSVWRELSVPAVVSFAKLHQALQISFGWADTHSYEFTVDDPEYDPKSSGPQDLLSHIMRMEKHDRAMLDDGEWLGDPSAPREYLVRIMDDAHEQRYPSQARGKRDRVHATTRAHPRTPIKKSSSTKLFQVFDNSAFKGKPMTYTYDLGDNWEHKFAVTGTVPATTSIECIGGEGHPVAEDVGHIKGWKGLLDAYRTTRPGKEQRDLRDWYEHRASNGDSRGLAGRERVWDQQGVCELLRRLS